MANLDIRWKQRFQNYEKAVAHLQEAVSKKDLSDLEKAGVVQTYEFTFELGWKTVKDYLQEKDIDVKFPREVIKEGYKYDIIKDGDAWIDMLQKRNLMSHTYNEKNAELAYKLIEEQYYDELYDTYQKLKKEL